MILLGFGVRRRAALPAKAGGRQTHYLPLPAIACQGGWQGKFVEVRVHFCGITCQLPALPALPAVLYAAAGNGREGGDLRKC